MILVLLQPREDNDSRHSLDTADADGHAAAVDGVAGG